MSESAHSQNRAPRFTIVIPTYQRRDVVLDSVRALEQLTFDGSFEVIVVVDGSTDGSADALRELKTSFPLTVLEHPNRGLAATRNRGAEASQGEVILFLDDDMEAHPRLLIEHDTAHRNGADVILGHVPLHPASPPNFLSRWVGRWAEERSERLSRPDAELALQDLVGGHLSISRPAFESVNGFDSTFTDNGLYGGEDLDFGYRLLKAGLKIVFLPTAMSYQRYVVPPRTFVDKWREAGRSDVLLARKHPEQANLIFSAQPQLTLSDRLFGRLLRPFLRRAVLMRIERGEDDARVESAFAHVSNLEYWRGVRQAGGRPKLPTLRILCYHSMSDLSSDPVLAEYGVTPERLRKQLRLLERLGFRFVTPDELLNFVARGALCGHRPVLVTFDDCYADLSQAIPLLRELGVPSVAFAVSALTGGFNEWDIPLGASRIPLMNAEALRHAESSGVEIGSHSRTHPSLTWVSAEQVAEEVSRSIDELQELGLRRPRLFAYPHGEHDDRVHAALLNAGIAAGFTVTPGPVVPGSNRFALPRIEVLRRDGTVRFLVKTLLSGRRFHESIPLVSAVHHVSTAAVARLRELLRRRQPIVAIALHPSGTAAGVGFNVQTNGMSALAVACENVRAGDVIVFGGRPLQTQFATSSLLTALVPQEVYSRAAKTKVWIRGGLSRSNELTFEIRDE